VELRDYFFCAVAKVLPWFPLRVLETHVLNEVEELSAASLFSPFGLEDCFNLLVFFPLLIHNYRR
jgi:hypothetical protein